MDTSKNAAIVTLFDRKGNVVEVKKVFSTSLRKNAKNEIFLDGKKLPKNTKIKCVNMLSFYAKRVIKIEKAKRMAQAMGIVSRGAEKIPFFKATKANWKLISIFDEIKAMDEIKKVLPEEVSNYTYIIGKVLPIMEGIPKEIQLRLANFNSTSGSTYWYDEKGVWRVSDHWGRVATCFWTIDGKDSVDLKPGHTTVAFCEWENFKTI